LVLGRKAHLTIGAIRSRIEPTPVMRISHAVS
jgi:hypothetical protein